MCGFESRLRHHFSGRSADRVLEVSGMITATRSPLHTALCDRLGIRYPICQAGMAFVARGSPALLREEIRRVPQPTHPPFRVAILLATIRTSGPETEAFTDAVRGRGDVAAATPGPA